MLKNSRDWERALSFVREGQDKSRRNLHEEAIQAFRAAGDIGFSAGYFMAADVAWSQDLTEEENELMSKVESLAANGDSDANLALSLAHRSWYGSNDFDESNKKANFYLRRSAELGNPTAQTILACNALSGANDEIQSLDEYKRWINLAIDNGSVDALIVHCEDALKFGWKVDERHRQMLSEIALTSPQANKLLRRILRRPRP